MCVCVHCVVTIAFFTLGHKCHIIHIELTVTSQIYAEHYNCAPPVEIRNHRIDEESLQKVLEEKIDFPDDGKLSDNH